MDAETMLVDGVEHELFAYNDDSGYGLAICGERVGPWHIGPRFEQVSCKLCLRIASLHGRPNCRGSCAEWGLRCGACVEVKRFQEWDSISLGYAGPALEEAR